MSDVRDEVIESAERKMMFIENDRSEIPIAESEIPIDDSESPNTQFEAKNNDSNILISQSEIPNGESDTPNAKFNSPDVQVETPNDESKVSTAQSESPDTQSSNSEFAISDEEPSMILVIQDEIFDNVMDYGPPAETNSLDVVNPRELINEDVVSLVFRLPFEDGISDVVEVGDLASDVTSVSSGPSVVFDIVKTEKLNEENVSTDEKPKLFNRVFKFWKRNEQDVASAKDVKKPTEKTAPPAAPRQGITRFRVIECVRNWFKKFEPAQESAPSASNDESKFPNVDPKIPNAKNNNDN